jgi:hypothetical protein
MMAKTAKDSAEHIVKILRDKGVKRNQDGQMSWLIEPFNAHPWTSQDLENGLIYALDHNWLRDNRQRITLLV